MSRYSGAQGKGAARRVREQKQDEAEARNPSTAKIVAEPVEVAVETAKR
jgi:hypothetical protein